MSATEYEDSLTDVEGQTQQDLLHALDEASAQLRKATAIQSAVGIREACEAIVAARNALEKVGR